MNKSSWSLQDAKTQFSQVVEAAMQGEPQHVTRRGHEAVVVLSASHYRALKQSARVGAPGFAAHLRAIPMDPEPAAERARLKLREIDL